jgi:phosphate transport system permease protein
MSSEAPAAPAPAPSRAPRRSFRARRAGGTNPHTPHGEPLLWLTGGALVFSLAMIVSLLLLIFWQGIGTFWPLPLIEIKTSNGTIYLGEPSRQELFVPSEGFLQALEPGPAKRAKQEMEQFDGRLHRRLLRTGNFDVSQSHFHWIESCLIEKESRPEWAVILERLTWGRFYGTPAALVVDGKETTSDAPATWKQFEEQHAAARARWHQRVSLEEHDLGELSRRRNDARLALRAAELDYPADSPQVTAAQSRLAEVTQSTEAAADKILVEIAALNRENARYQLKMTTVDGQEKLIPLEEIVRGYPANQLSWFGKLGVYLSRWKEFLTDDPREANSEGGVFPAIFGTVVMTLLMSVAVAPFGVLAALYLREYAKPGFTVSLVRIAINNLAGVPSVVFGVFGLGFFCYVMGASIDQLFFRAALSENTPTFGTGGLLWASLTLALLTLPVVIITTEEALSAVPSSMREGSYACGASKWQTIQRIVLPRALPGIMTGMILAMARGAGEVAPLMLVGVVKLAPELPVDGVFPFVHAQRSFMHLGFHIFDLGFQSSNSEAAKPMVFTTTLMLISVIAFLNIVAVWIRGRLRRKFISQHF